MKELYELKDKLMRELKDYSREAKISGSSLEVIDKLAHATKNICKVIEECEKEEYSQAGGMSHRGGSYGMSHADGYYNPDGTYSTTESYARGRGRNAARDSMGRYSSEGYSRGGMAEELEHLMQRAPMDMKQDFQRLMNKMNEM